MAESKLEGPPTSISSADPLRSGLSALAEQNLSVEVPRSVSSDPATAVVANGTSGNNDTSTTAISDDDSDLIIKTTKLLGEGQEQINKASGQDLAMFLGATGAGKSTTLDYFYGVELELVFDEQALDFVIKPKEGQVAVAEIGHGTTSKTLYPAVVPSEELSLTFCDTPGFRDSRGPEYDITGSFMIKGVVEKAASIKCIVFVVNFKSIQADRGEGFKKSLSQLATILDDVQTFKDTLIFSFNRYPDNLTPSIMAKFLPGLLFGSSDATNASPSELQVRDLVEIMAADDGKRILLTDVLDHEARSGSIELIKSCKSLTNVHLNYTVSETSHIFLLKMATQDKDNVAQLANQLRDTLHKYWTTRFANIDGSTSYQAVLDDIATIKTYRSKLQFIVDNPNTEENDVGDMARAVTTNTAEITALVEDIEEIENRLGWLKQVSSDIDIKTPVANALISVGLNDCNTYLNTLNNILIENFYIPKLVAFLETYKIQSQVNELRRSYESTSLLDAKSSASCSEILGILPEVNSVLTDNNKSVVTMLDSFDGDTAKAAVRTEIQKFIINPFDIPSITEITTNKGVAIIKANSSAVALSQVIEKAEGLLRGNTSGMTEFRLIIAGKLYVDKDMEKSLFSSRNVTIGVKQLDLKMAWKIDVSGNDGSSANSLTAPHVNRNSTAKANSGSHAGNILIVVDDIIGELDQIKMLADGGNGAYGQDGQDGEPGKDGTDGADADNPNSWPSVFTPFKKYPLWRYKGGTSGTRGGKGQSGGNSSKGGKGGAHGNMKIVDFSSKILVDNVGKAGQKGKDGTVGEGGNGGIGGKNGYQKFGCKPTDLVKSYWCTGYFVNVPDDGWRKKNVSAWKYTIPPSGSSYKEKIGGDTPPGGPDRTYAANGQKGNSGRVTLEAESQSSQPSVSDAKSILDIVKA